MSSYSYHRFGALGQARNIRMRFGPLSIIFLAACLFPARAIAQNDNWLGGSGFWSDASKWSAGVPTSSNSVFIDNAKAGASSVTINYNGAQAGSLTIDSDDSLTIVDPSIFTVFGPTIANAGTFSMNATSGAILDISGSVTLKGSGGLTLSNNANNSIMGYGQPDNSFLTNQTTIRGAGHIGSSNNGGFINQGTVNANQTMPLTVSVGNGVLTNTNGTLEATNNATLVLDGGATLTNTGGTIHADAASVVSLRDGPIIKNGTLTTSGTGTIQSNGGGNNGTLDGVTINGTFQQNTQIEYLANTVTNNGSFQINNGSIVDMSGAVTLKGTGTLTMSNNSGNAIMGYGQGDNSTFTNQITIQGAGHIGSSNGGGFINQGTVNANQTTPLSISVGNGVLTNTGTLEATNGATLSLNGAGTLTNTGGIIHADAGSIVSLESGMTIAGGTLTTSGSGTIQANCCFNDGTLDGVTNSGTFQLNNGNIEYLSGTITNNGSFQMNGVPTGGSAILDIKGSVTLLGSGTLTMSNANDNAIMGYGQQSGASLTSKITIQGAGSITPGSTNTFTNQHTVNANQLTPLIINGNFTNTGTLNVGKKSAMYITGGAFTNFSGATLTGGKYMVNGTLEFDGANIVTNSASIMLTGAKSQIIDQNAANALANFATNTKTGSFSLMSGKTLTTSGNVSNAGKLKVGPNSGLQTGSGSYTQTAGTTTIDGLLNAPTGVSIQAGKLFGKGTVAGTVVSSGAVTAGDTPKKTGKLSPSTYTQNANGSLNIAIGGLTAGTQYGQLAVANGASLNGTLNVTLINNFLPAIGNTFTILTTSARTGQFATVNGLSINGGEHFQISYSATSVTLTVVSGP
jgi:hypothetical protein